MSTESPLNPFFQGDISAAILHAKENNLVLMVAVYGDDDVSVKQQDTWTDPELASLISSSGVVALNLLSSSKNGQFFSSFCPVATLPSVIFLTSTGQVLQRLEGLVTAQKITKHLAVLKLRKGPKESDNKGSTSESKANAQPDQASAAGSETVIELSADMSLSDPRLSTEQKKELLQLKVKATREKKAKAEKQANIERTKKNFKENKELLAAQQHLQEEREKYAAAEMAKKKRKEKEINKGIRARVRAARAEQIAELKKEKELHQKQMAAAAENASAPPTSEEKVEAEKPSSKDGSAGSTSSTTKIVIRLTDGQSLAPAEFEASALFSQVISHVTDQPLALTGGFKLRMNYPRATFTLADENKTLRELQLVPNASLTLVPSTEADAIPSGRAPASAAASAGGGGLFGAVGGLISSLNPFSWGSAPSSTQNAASASAPAASSQQTAAPTAQNPRNPRATTGRIHGLQHAAASDQKDENNKYWNGNSTMFGGDGDSGNNG